MYTSTAVGGVGAAVGTLAFTGFGVAWFVVVALIAIISGLLLVRSGRRRASRR